MKYFNSKIFFSSMLILGLGVGCGSDIESDIPGDEESGSFGGAGAKADGQFTACQLRNVLLFVNASTTTEEVLLDTMAPLRSRKRAAKNIIAHRDGDPSTTADDDLFDDLTELDDVSFVGPKTLKKLIDSIKSKCLVDLSSRPFIDSTTFTGSGGGFPRDNVELEATYTVTGIPSRQLRDILLKKDSRDRTAFSRMRKNRLMEAYTYGYPISEMPWDSKSHKNREKMPYIYFTIESGRFEQDDPTGPREISLGTDINDDTYLDTQHFDVTHAGMSMRGRARWDTVTSIRRILIAAKSAVEVDGQGIKRAAKIDVRRDSPSTSQVASTVDDIRSGSASWNRQLPPVKTVYDSLDELGLLPDIEGRKKVLLLDPMAHLRSTRSRFHFNEATIRSLVALQKNGLQRITDVSTMASEKLAAGSVTDANDIAALEALVATAGKITDKTLIVERVNAELANAGLSTSFDVSTLPSPDSFQMNSESEVQETKIVAETLSKIMHDFADQLDDADRIITEAERAFEDHTAWYKAFINTNNASAARDQTFSSVISKFESTPFAAGVETEYNTFGTAQKADGNDDFEDFEDISNADWNKLGNALRLERVKVYQRQIEAGGTLAEGLWFDAAREFYVPASNRHTSNFLIDTTDMTDMITHEEWESIPEAGRRIDVELPANKIFHTTFVNEVQIELGSETAFLDRIESLQEKINAGNGTDEDKALIAGAQFVFDEYRSSLAFLAELKEKRIAKYLKRGGAKGFKWKAATHSKGHTALLIIADEL